MGGGQVSDLSDWRVLITGGSGFIGTNLIGRLQLEGTDLVNIDVRPPRAPGQQIGWHKADLLDRAAVTKQIEQFRPTHIVHLAARTDLHGKDVRDYAVNTAGTRWLMQAAAGVSPPPRVILTSSRMVCEIGYQPEDEMDFRPPNPYGASKVEMEVEARRSDYPGCWLIVRPTSIWGPWFEVPYLNFFLAVARGRYLHPRGARILKSFGYVENTIEQLLGLLAADSGAVNSRMFYLADYKPLEVGEWARLISAATRGPKVRSSPLLPLRGAAAIGTLLQRLGWSEPPLTLFRLRNLMTEMIYDLEPVRAHAPDLPFPLEEAVDRTARWLTGSGYLHDG